jgi:hypothetical protein
MFKTIIDEYEQKNSYFFKMPNTRDSMYKHLHLMFPTPQDFKGKSKESEDLLIETAKKINPNILKDQTTSFTKNYIIPIIAGNSFVFEKIMEILKIKNGDDPTATQWEEVITKRGNYELAVGYNYKANYIGMKIAMAIRKATGNYNDEFKMPTKLPLNPNWSKLLMGLNKKEDLTKTDIILGDHKISMKKKGGSQIFSGGRAESYAILTYSLNRFIEDNEDSIIERINETIKRFSDNSEKSVSFRKNNNFSAYLLGTFKWSENVKNFVEMNKKAFTQGIENKATIILKSMATDYFKILKRENPNLKAEEFKQLFIDNIQKIWYDNLSDMKILEIIASNKDRATDEEIFQVENILASIRSNYRGDSVKGNKDINRESLALIKTKIQDTYNSKFLQYEKYIKAKKQFNISTKILNTVFVENPDVKKYMIYEAITGDFKFNKNNGSANHLCVFNTENGNIEYNMVDMSFVESIKDKFNIMYTFKSQEDDVEDDSKAALRAYYFNSKEESELLSFHMINENFVQYLRNKYKSTSKALIKILLMRIKKIFKKAGNKIKMLTKLFRSKISRQSIKIEESYL